MISLIWNKFTFGYDYVELWLSLTLLEIFCGYRGVLNCLILLCSAPSSKNPPFLSCSYLSSCLNLLRNVITAFHLVLHNVMAFYDVFIYLIEMDKFFYVFCCSHWRHEGKFSYYLDCCYFWFRHDCFCELWVVFESVALFVAFCLAHLKKYYDFDQHYNSFYDKYPSLSCFCQVNVFLLMEIQMFC